MAAGGFPFCAGGFCGEEFWAGASCAGEASASNKQPAAHSITTPKRANAEKPGKASCFIRLMTDCASLRNPRVPPELKNHCVRKYRRQLTRLFRARQSKRFAGSRSV